MICFLTHRPSKRAYGFAKQLLKVTGEKVSMVVDDCDYEVPYLEEDILPVIKIDRDECEKAGYRATVSWSEGRAYSRDKALYYFNVKNPIDEDIWFIEDDVFIPSYYTLDMINRKYADEKYDLLSANHCIGRNPQDDIDLENWYWKSYVDKFCPYPDPLASSMICAMRCSRKLLDAVHSHACTYGCLFMDEVFFNTLCLKKGLNVGVIEELKYITWSRGFSPNNIKRTHLYHPVKSDMQHDFYRTEYKKNKIKQYMTALGVAYE